MTNGEVLQTIWNVSDIKVYKASVFADIYPCKEMRFDKSWWFAEYNGSFPIPESTDLISREEVKARYKEQFRNSLVDKARNIDFSECAEIPCKRFNEFIDSIPSAVPESETLKNIEDEIWNLKEKCTASDYLGCGILDIIERYKKRGKE